MTGKIVSANGRIVCNVINCEGIAIFKWYYRRDQNRSLVRIGSSANDIGWLGYGEYICEVKCANSGITLSALFNYGIEPEISSNYRIEHKHKEVSAEWDFTKIPDGYISEIKQLVSQGNNKRLAMIHNDLALSDSYYCCGELNEVLDNFKKYINDLSRSEGEVVEGTE